MASFLDFKPKKVVCPLCGELHEYNGRHVLRFVFDDDILPTSVTREGILLQADNTEVFEACFAFTMDGDEETLVINAKSFVADRSNNSLFIT